MRTKLLAILLVVSFASSAFAQTTIHFPNHYETWNKTTIEWTIGELPLDYPVETAKVVAIGGIVPYTQVLVNFNDSGVFADATWQFRKLTLHKMDGYSGAPVKAYCFFAPSEDPGKGRFKYGGFYPPVGPAFDGNWSFRRTLTERQPAVSFTLLNEGQETVDLMCTDCAFIWTDLPQIDDDANLTNLCPVCGSVPITADTLTTENTNDN